MGESATAPPGVLVNANAGRVRAHPGMLERLRQLVPDERLRLTRSLDEIEPALRELRTAGIEALAIVGGDGTVTGSLTGLLHVWPHDDLPRVALLPGGSVNTIPRAFSGGAFPDRTLRRMLRPGERPPEVRRTPLRVRASGEPERYGFIFGNGALVRWLDLYHAQPQRGVAGAAAVLARSLSSLAVNGRLARGLFERFAARVEIDGVLRSERRFSAMAAAGLPDIGLGFRPFYLAGAEPGHIHWVMTDAGPLQLGMEIPAARFGLRNPRTRLEDASVQHVVIRSKPLAYTIDGDVFPPTEELEISAGPDMWFLNLV